MSKRLLAEGILDHCMLVVQCDSRREGVVVPEHLRNPGLVLNFSARFSSRSSLKVDDHGISQSLRFNGVWFDVVVPWSAVWALRANDTRYGAYIFTDAVPFPKEEVEKLSEALGLTIHTQSEPEPAVGPEPPKEKPKRERPAWMQVHDGGKED